jgi:hypothetical protein
MYIPAALVSVLGWMLDAVEPIRWLFPTVGLLLLLLGASFHHLTVEDRGERLAIRFGPIPLFRRSVRYDDIVSVAVDRSTILEGWGIHLSHRGGWVWNLWGSDCVLVELKRSKLRIGTDDPQGLAEFLRSKMGDDAERRVSVQ